MKLSRPRMWISLCSLAVVVMMAVIDVGRTSPGPLSSVHARVDALTGRSGCAECHGGWFSNMTKACLDCHASIATQIESRGGLHGRIVRPLADACATCHGEHHGASFAVVNAQTFARAGVADAAHFDHGLIGFAMDGRHLELACSECHANADAAVLEEGSTRYLGLAQDCASCHVDVHKGQMRVACATCHGQTAWDELHSVGHERWLPLVGGHGDVACRACHAEFGAHSLEALGLSAKPATTRECVECHASPHAPAFAGGVAALVNTTPGSACVQCHSAEHTSFGEASLSVTPTEHALSGFPLDLPHDKAACSSCHDASLATFAARYPGRSKDACSACHADAHGGQFETGPFAAQECTACHDRERFTPHTFTEARHALTSLPLTGKHASTACNDCHMIEADGAPRTFRGTKGRCEECHADAHAGFFAAVAATEPARREGECARCHSTVAFAEIAPRAFDHAHWTGFPIEGSHAQSECSSCHVTRSEPDDFGRRFSRVEDHFGRIEGCQTCHADPHQGAFDAATLPSTVDGHTGCARCHEESSFRSLPRGFDHERWTGFALSGEHQHAQCSTCHEPLRQPSSAGRTWTRAQGRGCADCHVDPHGGQFGVGAANDCARCHAAGPESLLVFDHDRDTRFHLREQHRGLECAACHKPYAAAGDLEITRYKPLGMECVDCHGVDEDVLARRKRRRTP